MRWRTLAAAVSCLAAFLATPATAAAQVFRCPVGGAIVFQQSPCAGLAASGGRLLIGADGQKVAERRAEPEPLPPPRVLGRTPLPTPMGARHRKSP